MRVMVCVGLLLCLAACENTKTKLYYLDHPEEIKTDLAECQKAGKNTYNCNQASLAEFELQHKGAQIP